VTSHIYNSILIPDLNTTLYLMSEFSLTIKHTLNTFKSTYRREIPVHIKTIIQLEKIDLKRQTINDSSDIGLYYKAHEVITYLENQMEGPAYHNGIDEFIQEIKEMLDAYMPYNDHLIHKNRHSSETLIRALQIITLEKITLNYDYLQKLKACCNIIIDINNLLHYEKLLLAIKTCYKKNPPFFDKLLQHCEKQRQSKGR